MIYLIVLTKLCGAVLVVVGLVAFIEWRFFNEKAAAKRRHRKDTKALRKAQRKSFMSHSTLRMKQFDHVASADARRHGSQPGSQVVSASSKLIVPEQKVSEFPVPQSPVPQSSSASFMQVIERAARDETVDIDKMERLWKMRQQMVAEEALREYNKAMAAAQSEMGPVTRDAENSSTSSKYARLETIDNVIRPIYTKHGFGLSFDQGDCPLEGHIRILCDVSHSGGHTVQKHWDLPLDSVGMKGSVNKTLVHANGSSISYGRRYLTCMIFNIVLKNEDNDKDEKRDREHISVEQINEIEKLIVDVGADRAKFMRYLKVESIGDIFADRMEDVKKLLNAKRKKK